MTIARTRAITGRTGAMTIARTRAITGRTGAMTIARIRAITGARTEARRTNCLIKRSYYYRRE